MYIVTMVSKHIENDEEEGPVTVIDRKRCRFIATPESLEQYQLRIAAHDTAGKLWRLWACEIDDDGGIVIGGEVVA